MLAIFLVLSFVGHVAAATYSTDDLVHVNEWPRPGALPCKSTFSHQHLTLPRKLTGNTLAGTGNFTAVAVFEDVVFVAQRKGKLSAVQQDWLEPRLKPRLENPRLPDPPSSWCVPAPLTCHLVNNWKAPGCVWTRTSRFASWD